MNIRITSPSVKVRKVQYNFSGSGTEPPSPIYKPKKPKKPKKQKKAKYDA